MHPIRAMRIIARKEAIASVARELAQRGQGNEALGRETNAQIGKILKNSADKKSILEKSRVGGKIPFEALNTIRPVAAERAGKRLAARYALYAVGLGPGKERNQLLGLLEEYENLRASISKGGVDALFKFQESGEKISSALGMRSGAFWDYYERRLGRQKNSGKSEKPV